MQIQTHPLTLTKRHPLTISRGTSTGSENLLIEVSEAGITGWGEFAPVSFNEETAATALSDIARWEPELRDLVPWEMQRVECVLDRLGGGRAARAALDMALHDWLGRRAVLPVYCLLGADPRRIAATSLTVGMDAPEVVRERVREVLSRTGAQVLKVKLGSPDGMDADQAILSAAKEAAPQGLRLRVDANGGWDVDRAWMMLRWLAEQGVEFVEQPLPMGQESDLMRLHADAPLPLFADESCHVSADVPKLAGLVDGINLKLMKAGGLREGLRVIHTARAHGLQVMIGCMSESSLAIAASVHLSPLADYLDLDSHLNLLPDPFTGLGWSGGRVLPGDRPGLGVDRLTVEAAAGEGEKPEPSAPEEPAETKEPAEKPWWVE